MRKYFVIISFIFLLFLGFINWQPVEINDFTGGINNSVAKDNLKGNEFLQLQNFIFRNGKIQTREGYSYYLTNTPLSNYPIEYMGIYKTEEDWKLLACDGISLWILDDSTDLQKSYNPFHYSTGKISGDQGDSIVYGSDSTQAWLSFIGDATGNNLYLYLADDSIQISHIILDTVLILSDTLKHDYADSNYEISLGFSHIYDGINYGTVFYFGSDYGFFKWDGDSIRIVDSSEAAIRYQVDSVIQNVTSSAGSYGSNYRDWTKRRIRLYLNDEDFGCGSCSTWTSGQYNGWYAQYSTDPYFTDTGLQANDYFKVLAPIRRTGNCILELDAYYTLDATFPGNQFIYLSQRTKDEDNYRFQLANSSTTDSTNAFLWIGTDSLDGDAADLGAGMWYFATKYGVYFDSSIFEQGDYIVYNSADPYNYYFIAGGIEESYGSWEILPLINKQPYYYIYDTLITLDTFLYLDASPDTVFVGADSGNTFVLTRLVPKRASTSGAGVEYMEHNWSRLFWKPADMYQTVKCSEPFMPESTLAGNEFTIETRDGDEITGIRRMGDRLLVYKNYSVSELYPTTLAYTEESQEGPFAVRFLTDEIGCIAPKTLIGSNEHYFLSAKGFVVYQGGASAQTLSAPISKWLDDSLDIERASEACAIMTDDGLDIWLSLPSIAAYKGNQVTFVLNLKTGAWTRFDFAFNSAIANRSLSNDYKLFFSDADSGRIYSYGGDFDNGDSIEAIIQSGYVNFGLPERYVHSRDVIYDYEKPASATVRLISSFYDDFNSSIVWADTATNTESFGQNNVFCDPSVYGANLSLLIKITNAHDVKISFIKWFLQAGGYIK